ncbi:hypothetical protein [Neobacillus niacini]|uniref:hypothetical protein n=1 Tax=Neobacillus niacini TaxID=86668 RepID=UPI00285FF14A|nr:hypothetical protein [Neobacillus niacini]MDR7001625.1 hypothetical protein [Neobacillus niacini]
MKRDYTLDAKIALLEMNFRYQYWGNHPWIKETIIPVNEFQRQIYAEACAKVEAQFRRLTRR